MPEPRFDRRRRRRVTFALILVTALASFESTVVSTAMPTIIGDLNGLPLYSWVFSVYLLASTVTMPLYGRLADLYGRRLILLTAIGIFLTGALACATARSMPHLILARGLQGLGAGGLIPVALTVSGDLYAIEERARVQSLFSSVWGLASLLGPVIGAGMTLSFGWRSIFTINIPLGIFAAVLVATQMAETRRPAPAPIDLPGAALLTGGIAALLFSVLTTAGRGGPSPPQRAALVAAGLLLLALFAGLQRRRAHPLVPPLLFSRRATAAPYVGGILLGTTIYGVDTFVPLFVQGARGGTAGSAGAVVTPLVFCWALSAALAARVVVRLGFRATARAGALLIVGGFAVLLVLAHADAGVPAISAACALIGLGLGPSSISQVLAVQHAAPEEVRGVATSLVPFFRTTGGSLGVGALGGLFAAGLARRLGGSAEAAGALLTAPFRHAVGSSLLPVFAVLLVLSALNVAVTGAFPGRPAAS